MGTAMNSRNVMWSAAICVAAMGVPAMAQDGVPGDRLVVPLPDVSALSDDEAQALARELAQMNVITSECPDHDVSDPEWQLMNGTTDALTARLGLDPLAYDREYFRPAFSVLDDPEACDRLGPEAPALIARLEQLGGGTTPVTPGLQAEPGTVIDADTPPEPAPEADADAPQTDAPEADTAP